MGIAKIRFIAASKKDIVKYLDKVNKFRFDKVKALREIESHLTFHYWLSNNLYYNTEQKEEIKRKYESRTEVYSPWFFSIWLTEYNKKCNIDMEKALKNIKKEMDIKLEIMKFSQEENYKKKLHDLLSNPASVTAIISTLLPYSNHISKKMLVNSLKEIERGAVHVKEPKLIDRRRKDEKKKK